MSFELTCVNCGADSGPSVGVCPYCKSVMVDSRPGKTVSPAYKKLAKLYSEGNLELSLTYVHEILKQEDKYGEDADLLIVASKILIETEGPNGRTRALLGRALLVDSDNREVIDYLDIIQAKLDLDLGSFQIGKENLTRILQRSPDNPHALFLMGSSLFWKEHQLHEAIPYLEKCVRVRPKFLRAWACLAAIAKELGNPQLAQSALLKCLEMEKNARMRGFFQNLLDGLSSQKAA